MEKKIGLRIKEIRIQRGLTQEQLAWEADVDRTWKDYINSLDIINGNQKKENIKRIEKYITEKKYEPNLELKEIANNLYNDVGAVAQTLIDLRYKQAEDKINSIYEE